MQSKNEHNNSHSQNRYDITIRSRVIIIITTMPIRRRGISMNNTINIITIRPNTMVCPDLFGSTSSHGGHAAFAFNLCVFLI